MPELDRIVNSTDELSRLMVALIRRLRFTEMSFFDQRYLVAMTKGSRPVVQAARLLSNKQATRLHHGQAPSNCRIPGDF
jgi:hypothetical protein